MAVEADAVIIGTLRAQMHPEQGDLVRALQATRKPVIVLGLDTPYDPMAFPEEGTSGPLQLPPRLPGGGGQGRGRENSPFRAPSRHHPGYVSPGPRA